MVTLRSLHRPHHSALRTRQVMRARTHLRRHVTNHIKIAAQALTIDVYSVRKDSLVWEAILAYHRHSSDDVPSEPLLHKAVGLSNLTALDKAKATQL